jgi:hypothetical protein
MLTHGIDLHKRDLVIATVDAEGVEVGQKRVRAREADVLRYFSTLSGPHRAMVESTGSGYWLADLCREHRIYLTLAHARKLKAISAAKVKTDRVDSLTLAQLLRADLIPEAHMISPELRPLRDVLRARLRLVEKRSSCLNSIARLLEKYNVDSAASLSPLGAASGCLPGGADRAAHPPDQAPGPITAATAGAKRRRAASALGPRSGKDHGVYPVPGDRRHRSLPYRAGLPDTRTAAGCRRSIEIRGR